MRRVFAVALLSLALTPAATLLAPSVASACSCMPSPGPLEAARGVDVVFSAKLVSVEDQPAAGPGPGPGPGPGMGSKLFTFDVSETYKGQLDAQVRVATADNSAACGRNYGEPGSEWLVYARVDDEGQLHDNLCSRTMALADASEDIEALVANADTLDQPPAPEDPGPGPAEPEPEPIDPDAGGDAGAGDDGPEPAAPSKKGCAVGETDPGPAGLLALVMLGLGLGLGLGARRR